MKVRSSAIQPLGKRVGDALYLHVSAVTCLKSHETEAINEAIHHAGIGRQAFNVVKLSCKDSKRVSLLAYEGFDANPFPALLDSWTVDVEAGTCSHRSYRASRNPPILHRKELLLPLDDPRRTTFARLTEALVNRGLFVDPKSIGFKRQWNTRLGRAGIAIVNHEVVDASALNPGQSKPPEPIARFRTAISRSGLSAPVQALDRHGFLSGAYTVFDYGCGRGGDLAALTASGITASGWDPYFAPEALCEEADLVNLGFVLNVIEDPGERKEVLQSAFALARRVLSIAVMTAGREDTSRFQPHGDGYLSSRGTFQKYFSQQELRELVRNTLDEEAIPVAPGVFFAFRDKILEQRFLERRSRRDHGALTLRSSPRSAKKIPLRHADALLEENRELIEALWQRALELGRPPDTDELQPEIVREIQARLGSIGKATRVALASFETAALEHAASARTDDLTLYFAMNLFGERKRYRQLAPELRRDVRAFFGSYSGADGCARKLLFSLADATVLQGAAAEAQAAGIGYFDGTRSITIDARLLGRLPTKLRAYIGCAELLYGDIAEADLVKIDVLSRKLTLQKYQNYDVSPLPLLRERVRIDLRRQDIRFYDHRNRESLRLLYLKSRYMTKDLPCYRQQVAFDRKLTSLGLLPPDAPEPPASEFGRLMRERRLMLRGFDIGPMPAPSASREGEP